MAGLATKCSVKGKFVIEAELLRSATRTRAPLRPSLCRLWMRWTRLLSRILGTGTSTTCFRMRSETRSGVITLTMSSVCLSGFSCGISCWISCGTSCGIDVSVALGWVLNLSVSGLPVPDLVAKLRRCFVDLRFQRTGSATM